MLNENQLSEDTSENRKSNPCRRRRSNSVDSKRNSKGNDYLTDSNGSENSQKYKSSGHLFNIPDNMVNSDIVKSPRCIQETVKLDNFFVNWLKDPKLVKNDLTRLHENNIFKTEFPNLEKYNSNDYYPPVMFIISHSLKIDNDYEIYTINNYDLRISELMIHDTENKKDISDEYQKGFKAISQKVFDIANSDFDHDENKQVEDDQSKNGRRHSEIMGLIIANKNQPVSYFLPNKTSNGFEVIIKVGDVTVIDQAKRSDKSFRHIILSNDVLSIYASKKAERLKYKFFLKHLYCEICTDHQIQNIDSSVRIGGPFGDDLILMFANPKSRMEWNTAIQSSISTLLEPFKTHTTEITVLKHLELNSSAPLISKLFSVSGKTTGLELKKKAMESFIPTEKNIGDLILAFNINNSNREFVLHDDVIVMILLEHIGCFADNTCCNEKCISNSNVPSRTHFYLKYNPLKIKKPKPTLDFKPGKLNKYSISDRWTDNIIPDWILILLSDIYYQGSQVEGIFRVSGAKNKSDNFIQLICCNTDNNIEINDDIITKSNTLKKFFSSIDGSIFTFGNKEKLIALSSEIESLEHFSKNTEQKNKLINIIQSLPRNNHTLLQLLLVVINHISENDAVNKMSLSNLAVCWAPSLLTEMNESTTDEFQKTKILCECILSLIDKIVDESAMKKLLPLLKQKLVPIESNGVSTEDSIANNESVLKNPGSDMIDEVDGSIKIQPSVPPRKKRSELDNQISNDDDSNDGSNQKSYLKKFALKNMRNSFSEEMATNSLDGKQDITSNNNVNLRPQVKKRASRDRHTVSVAADKTTDASPGTKESLQSPFRRVNPVNRKHRDHSMTNLKINENDPITATLIQPSPPDLHYQLREHQPRITRNHNRLINKVEPRFRGRSPVTKTFDKQLPASDLTSSPNVRASPSGGHQRSSSSSRFENIKDRVTMYEKNNTKENSFVPGPKSATTALQIQKTYEIRPKGISRNVRPVYDYRARPIQPSRGILDNNLVRPRKSQHPSPVHRSNTMESTLKKTIEKSEDKDVTII